MAQRNASNNKITKYRKPLNLNIGIIIFGVVFIYIIIGIFSYLTSEHIVGYEVPLGVLSTNNVYKGIALREESIFYSNSAGYINYYAREGERVAYNNLVYTVDETGRLSDYINAAALGENALSDEDLSELKSEIVEFSNLFSRDDFSTVYDFKYSVKGTVLKLANIAMLENAGNISSEGASLISYGRASDSGIVIYSTDGYEDKTIENLTADDFDAKEYKKNQLISNELVAANDPVYKLATNENWMIVIQTEEEKAKELLDEDYVKIRFLKNQDESWAKVSTYTGADGSTLVGLSFSNSMVSFCTDRFIDIELILDEDRGLKIPKSSIVEKQFYLVPEEYITQGGSNNSYGVIRESYLEGTQTTEFVETNVYSVEDGEYYLDDSTLRLGDRLIKPDSTDTYTISKQGTLIGVYNINKGYADFKQIVILDKNEEYAIVQSNTAYGLNVYDYIVLDATTVNEDDFIYE
ncbi:MAG: hypothetical protein K2K54_02005 [Lachnospiraceae bacterium]|nr:hypothetical protein [Lachnospiraceae bacterium]